MVEYDRYQIGCIWDASWKLPTASCRARNLRSSPTSKIRNVTRPHQQVTGMKQGPELLHKIVSAHVSIHKDAAMANVGVKNAHGSVEWRAIQKEIEALDDNLSTWCAVLFKAGYELTCKLDDGGIITHWCLAQGCPMSSLIFLLTVHRTVCTVENQLRNADPNARVNIFQHPQREY